MYELVTFHRRTQVHFFTRRAFQRSNTSLNRNRLPNNNGITCNRLVRPHGHPEPVFDADAHGRHAIFCGRRAGLTNHRASPRLCAHTATWRLRPADCRSIHVCVVQIVGIAGALGYTTPNRGAACRIGLSTILANVLSAVSHLQSSHVCRQRLPAVTRRQQFLVDVQGGFDRQL